MGYPETIALIISVIALIISGLLAYLEIRRYYLPLKMDISDVSIISLSSDKTGYLILYHIVFINPASRGRTICKMDYNTLTLNARLFQATHEYEDNYTSIIYYVPDFPNTSHTLKLEEALTFPLDIPSQQSKSVWCPLVVTHPYITEIKCINISIQVKDIFRNVLAKYNKDLDLKTYSVL